MTDWVKLLGSELPPDQYEDFAERMAIMQENGLLSEAVAEQVLKDTREKYNGKFNKHETG